MALASRRCRCHPSTLCEQLAISIQTRRMASPSLHTPFHSIWRCCIHDYVALSRYNAGMHSPWHYRRVYTVGDLLYTMKTSREARLASRATHTPSLHLDLLQTCICCYRRLCSRQTDARRMSCFVSAEFVTS